MVEKIGSEDWPTHVSYHKDPVPEMVRDFLPYVAMLEPLVAWRLKCGWGCFLSAGDGGSTLTVAPVSTKKVQ